MYQSADHSLVNDLLKAGEITEEDARDFPQKNVITRAMQPHLAKRYKADVFTFDDIRDGDWFFLCSDGVLERLSNEMLCEILADPDIDDRQKMEKIKTVCEGQTKDNFTAWLVPVSKVVIKQDSGSADVIQADAVEVLASPEKVPSQIACKDCKTTAVKIIGWIMGLLTVFAILYVGIHIYKMFK